MTKVTKVCTLDGCESKHFSLGYCQKHYRRLKRTGSPLYSEAGAPGHQDPENGLPKVQVRATDVQGFSGPTAPESPAGMRRAEQASVIGSGQTRYQVRGRPCGPQCAAPDFCYRPEHPTYVPLDTPI